MERLKNKTRLAGIKQVTKAILAQRAETAFIARDCDAYIIEELENLCSENNVPVVYAETMKELAKACHVEVPTAVAAILGKDA